ncbi:sulfolipid-1 biosynthesis phthioceranic/hydroxyphthioceranic acid synthase [Mycobacterium hubeiense]|uniref:sulfolipid-1 biosynthesis phthioceranic/hydroxyphthioceranic acid synthase n=1 Tax=Mycobacterium hubeiense TaxID=1867256 RepID=UPI000C7F33C0|nr:type I polyketide synthase [Mycobacterium sp. QGD 101]
MGETRRTHVAVIGIGCRLPGGIDSPDQLWDALLRGANLVTEVPPDRWDVDEYYDPEPGVPGRSVSRWGAFLDDVAGFDPEFFGIGEREATAIDPQHRLLLETSWEAVEHAGINPTTLHGSLTGVFVGLTHGDYELLSADAHVAEGPYGFTGTNFSMASGRIAYTLGAHGPAVTVDTACSSSLLALHLACRSLQQGESDLAIAGGATVTLDPRKSTSGSAQGMLSPTGRCHAFDAAADGFVASEGCAVVLVKRLSDAMADGDRILAVIRGTAANQDGRTVNIATPSLDAQVAAYRAALAAAEVDAGSIGMVEAHGTGTPVGDPIEYASLARVYGTEGPCALGSVKTNFGHGQSASGAMGLVKAILALQHGVVPQNLHFTRLPDDLAKIDTELFVPQANTPWPTNGRHPRRAAVSSYGLSGTNVHAIIEQAPEQASEQQPEPAVSKTAGPLIFPISSTSPDELRRTSGRLADWLDQHGSGTPLADLGYTLSRRRAHRPVRTAVIAEDCEQLTSALREIAEGDSPYQAAVGQDDRGPVWVFSGQGSQWAAMGAALLACEPVFAETVAQAEPLIARESGFSVTEAMSAPQTVTGIDRIQPTLFTMQVALAATLRSYGVVPGAVIGHSLGEAAASVVAGALSLEDGVRVICRRSRLMSTIAGSGAMASVELPAAQVLSELAARGISDVVLSVVASPQSTVVGGATQSVRELVAAWEQREVMAREVAVDVASHSPQVDPILDELIDALADLTPAQPTVPYYSATLFDPRDRPAWDADYWADNLRHTVRFAAAVQAALEDGYRVFGELAPHPLLTHAIDQTARSLDIPLAALAGMRREQEMPYGLRGFVTDLHCAGAAVDFSVMYPHGRLVDAPLPTWTHRRLLLSRDSHDIPAHGASTVPVHPLLGHHVRLPEEPERHVWQADIGTEAQPWLGDHQVHEVAALPGAAYCEMALAGARAVLGDGAEVRDIRFEQMLLLDDETPVSAVATVSAPDSVDFVVETAQDGETARRASAVLHTAEDQAQPPTYHMSELLEAHPTRVEGAEMRKWFDQAGIQYGPAFAGLTAVGVPEGTVSSVLAEVALPGPIRSQQGAYNVHPALLDACFQSVAAHPDVQGASAGGLLLPLGVRRLRAYSSTRNAHYCYARVTGADATGIEADLDVLDEHGAVLLAIEGLRLGTGDSENARRNRVLNDRLLTIDWQQRELPPADHHGGEAWLLIDTSETGDEMAGQLAEALKHAGAQCSTMNWPVDADHDANAERLAGALGVGGFAGLIVLAAPPGGADDQCAVRGREQVAHLVRIARGLPDVPGEPTRLYVMTRDAQTVVPGDVANLEQAGLRGLMRVIGTEHPHLRASQIDVDKDADASQLAQQLLGGSEEDETAWRNGQWYTARLCPTPLRPEERHTAVVEAERDGLRLQIRTPGDLESMELVAFERIPPGPGQIEVAITASSINFADVLVTFGRYPSFEGHLPQLGTDFAGVVTAVGPDVTTHRVGDHVGGMSPDGCWATFATCDADRAVTLPAGLSDGDAAAVTTAHATAWYGLHDLARISARDKVLIHSATGGVGQAAMAIARAAGAQIFATAGSADRRDMLRDMGIEHVYDSRSVDFAEQIRRDTDGYGVDIVLNSLPGAAQRAGLELLAFGGRFVEIGKRDIYGDTRLGLFPFRRNLSFYAVDLGLLSVSHPDTVRDLLRTVYESIVDGTLPIPHSTHYPLAEAATAIRSMSAAQHTGKLVLDIPHTGAHSVAVPPEQAKVFRSDGAYIITGGLGGLGLFFAEKLAAAGCGRIVLNGRSQPNVRAQEIIELIRATGADIEVECGDIADAATAQRLVACARATGLAVRGVLHAAAVVEDATLANITDELIDHDWAPKVYGAWNLHQATADQPLDWFCSFSSAAALVGSPGQGAYAAANSWLDAFSHWRRAQGLPATAIAWGAWAEIGRATALAEASETAITPDDGAHAFETLVRHSRAYSGYAPILGAPWLADFAQRSKFAELFASMGQKRADTGKFRAELNALPREEWPTRLRRLVSEQVGLILRRSIDPDRPLPEYGLDSLSSLELRTRIETETGIRITSTDITTVRGLAEYLCDKLAPAEDAATSS